MPNLEGDIFIPLPTLSCYIIITYLSLSCLPIGKNFQWARTWSTCEWVWVDDNGWSCGFRRLHWLQLRLPCWVGWGGGVTPQHQVWEGGTGWEWEGGRGAVDGARNWFPAAAQPAFSSSISSSPQAGTRSALCPDLWLTAIWAKNLQRPKNDQRPVFYSRNVMQPWIELQLWLGKAGKLGLLRSQAVVVRGALSHPAKGLSL